MDRDEAIEILLEMIYQAVRGGYLMGTTERKAYDRLREEYPR